MKRFILLLLTVLMLASCAPAAVPTAPRSTLPATQPAEESLYLFKEGKSNCQVVISVSETFAQKKVGSDLRDALNRKFKGSQVKLVMDVKYDESLVSVFVGETRSALSKELYEKLEWYQVGILIRDGQVAIGAGIEENLELACNWFRREYVKVENDAIALPTALELLQDADISIPAAPEFSQADEPVVVDCGDDCYLKRYNQTTPESFAAYCTTLEQAGFAKVMENTISNNLYASYTDGKTDVHFNYIAHTGVTRVVQCPASNMVPRETDAVVPEGATNDVYMLSTREFGLSMVIHMKDGRFIVIDGAFNTESKNLVQFLESLAPAGEKPVIAAWIFTHAHPDHTYAFWGLQSAGLTDNVTVERFVFNFPSEKMYEEYEPDCIDQTANVLGVIKGYFPDSQVIKPHTGNQMILGDIVVDFLCTQEDVLPNGINDFNDSSLVMRFTMDGQRLLVTGDMSGGEFTYCNEAFDDADLKADVFQAPHHGYNLNADFFQSVSPRILLVPNKDEAGCNSVLAQRAYAAMVEKTTQWVGSFKTWKLSMPFEGDTPCVPAWKDAVSQ